MSDEKKRKKTGKRAAATKPRTPESADKPQPPPTEDTAPSKREAEQALDPGAGGTSASTKASALIGLVAAMVLAVLVNVLAARHYRRFDFTEGGLFTLSKATAETLHALGEPIRIDVLLPSSDAVSIQHLLEAYRAETSRLDVHFTDPDRHPAEFLAVQRKYEGRVVSGRVVENAAVVISRGERVAFVASRDLVEVEDENEMRARPRLEQALTAGIREVVSTDKPEICFIQGHGEKPLDEGPSNLAQLRDRLTKNGFSPRAVVMRGADADPEKLKAPFAGCRVVVVAGPSERIAEEEAKKIDAFLEGGGSALVAAGPVPDEGDRRYVDLGLNLVLARFGLSLEKDFVFEVDDRLRSTRGFGETFLPIAKPHPITEELIRAESAGLGAVLTVASSLRRTGTGLATATPLLVTSDDAFGMVDFFTWAKNPSEPAPNDADHRGPITVAYASELPAKPSAARGSRLVALSSASPMMGENWQNEELRGTAIFVESALAWLASMPTPLDIPNKPSFTAGLRLSEDSLASIFRYVVIFIPLASVLIGIAVHLRRRTTEKRSDRKESAA